MQTDFLDGLKTAGFDFHSAGVMPPNKKSPQKCGLSCINFSFLSYFRPMMS